MSIRKTLGPVVVAAFSALLLLLAPTSANAAPGDETAYPPPTAPAVITINGDIGPGATVTIIVNNFYGNESVAITGSSTPYSLGNYVTDANGSLAVTVTLPQLEPGDHSITVTGSRGSFATFAFTVPDSGGAASVAGGGSASTGGDQLAWTGVAVGGLVVLALALLIGGTLVLLSGKRRTSA